MSILSKYFTGKRIAILSVFVFIIFLSSFFYYNHYLKSLHLNPVQAQTPSLNSIAPGTWYAVNQPLKAVMPVYGAPGSPQGNPFTLIAGWNSGAYDTYNDQMIVMGGGHADYSGNEAYAFSLSTLTWKQIMPPSNPGTSYIDCSASGGNSQTSPEIYPDGTPASRHTYDAVVYMPSLKKVFVAGGSLWGDGHAGKRAWLMDSLTGAWTAIAPTAPDCQWTELGAVAAYDPVTQHIFYTNPAYAFSEYDPVANTWTIRSSDGVPYGQWTGAIDPKRHLMVMVGSGGRVRVWNLSQIGLIPAQDWTVTGDTEILNGTANETPNVYSGIVYDPVVDKMVLWGGGTAVYVLDLDAKTIKKIPAASGNTVVLPNCSICTSPITQSSNGIFHHWEYIPSKDLFVAVTDINDPVYFYKLDPTQIGGAPPPPPPTPGQISLAANTWTAIPLFQPFASGVKHTSVALDPDNGRLYLTGGDHLGPPYTPGGLAAESYRQETYSFSLADRFASLTTLADSQAGFRLEFPYCGPTGVIQPESPDFHGWVWDTKRHVFWAVFPLDMGGGIQNPSCPGQLTNQQALDASTHMMTFDPVTQKWAIQGSPYFTDHPDNLWATAYDPYRDQILKFFDGGVNIYDIATDKWTPVTFPLFSDGSGWAIHLGYAAADTAHQVVYAIDNQRHGHLARYHMDTQVIDDLGQIPGGGTTPCSDTNYSGCEQYEMNVGAQPKVVWDSTAQVLIYERYAESIWAYHPSTGTWDQLPETISIVGGTASGTLKPMGTVMFYDQLQDVIGIFGMGRCGDLWSTDLCTTGVNSAPWLFLYRYASASPPPPSAPTVFFSASPTSITSGQASTLTWSSTNATSCTASGGWSGTIATSGSQAVSPTQTTTYTLTCTGTGGSANQSVTISVSSPSPPPPTPSSTLSNITFIPNVEGQKSMSADTFTLNFYSPATGSAPVYTLTSTGSTILMSQSTLSPGTYDISISTSYHLRRKLTNASLSSNQTITMPLLYAGDLNNDSSINSLDWSIMSAKWFTNDPISDVNQDGIVNSIDFSFMNKNWGKSGD